MTTAFICTISIRLLHTYNVSMVVELLLSLFLFRSPCRIFSLFSLFLFSLSLSSYFITFSFSISKSRIFVYVCVCKCTQCGCVFDGDSVEMGGGLCQALF